MWAVKVELSRLFVRAAVLGAPQHGCLSWPRRQCQWRNVFEPRYSCWRGVDWWHCPTRCTAAVAFVDLSCCRSCCYRKIDGEYFTVKKCTSSENGECCVHKCVPTSVCSLELSTLANCTQCKLFGGSTKHNGNADGIEHRYTSGIRV